MLLYRFRLGFLDIAFVDLVDIFLVALLLYNLYKLIRGSVALRIAVGFLSLYLTYLVVKATRMGLLSEILGQFMEVGVLAAIILFQQEIRKFLLLIGRSTDVRKIPLLGWLRGKRVEEEAEPLDSSSIVEAMKSMSLSKTGALIVISKQDDLRFYAETGDILDAQISKRLLQSVFFKNSPLHDGAVLIQNNRLLAARCILPVTENQELPANMGLRHRAAVGMTEVTNTAVLTVSEETGNMSFVQAGVIYGNLTAAEVRQKIREYFTDKQVLSLKEKVVNPTVSPS